MFLAQAPPPLPVCAFQGKLGDMAPAPQHRLRGFEAPAEVRGLPSLRALAALSRKAGVPVANGCR